MGPLDGIVVIELSGIGPVPFCGMLLAEMGARVIRIDRPTPGDLFGVPNLGRSRESVVIDLKAPEGRDLLIELAASADVLIEGYRPGVAERLGIGPDDMANPALVYGRMTGWGQEGPLSAMAGHDINFIALTGALAAIGPQAGPLPPLNLVGDYGGGALYLALGVLAALIERESSGRGQVVDAAMVDGAASLMSVFYELSNAGLHSSRRESNFLDGGAPFYRAYETSDGEWMAVGALEPHFFAQLLVGLGLDQSELPDQYDSGRWPELADAIGTAFAGRTRAEWAERFGGTDACVTPVLSMEEAPHHEHNRFRSTFLKTADGWSPAPAPRLSRTPGPPPRSAPDRGADTDSVLADLGVSPQRMERLRSNGIVA